MAVAGKRPGWRQRREPSVLIAARMPPAQWAGWRREAATGCWGVSVGRWTREPE